jgi:hypothetical protein
VRDGRFGDRLGDASRWDEFRHAVELLPERDGRAMEDLALGAEAPDAELLGQVAAFYHETLLKAREGVAYLESRGLNDPALIERSGCAWRTGRSATGCRRRC